MTTLQILEQCARERLVELELEARKLRDQGAYPAAVKAAQKAGKIREALRFLDARKEATLEKARREAGIVVQERLPDVH